MNFITHDRVMRFGVWPELKKISLVMKLTTLLIIIAFMQTSAKTFSQVTLHVNNLPLEKVFNDIKKQTGYTFIYETDILQDKTVSVNVNNASIQSVLTQCLGKLPLTYRIIDNNIVITKKDSPAAPTVKVAEAPPVTITGRIVTEGKQPLPNAVIKIKGTKKGVLSNLDGTFELDDVPDNSIIQISFVGYKTKTIPLSGIKQPFEVVLEIDQLKLDEVRVSNGYNELPQDRATGSFGVITSKQIARTPALNLIQRLEGQIPGLQVNFLQPDLSFTYKNPNQNTVNNSLNPNYNISVRGISTFNANQSPLIVVDGVVTDIDIRTINPADVDQITVLKDAAAASIWGIRAANGVLVIQTKKGKYLTAPSVSFSANYNISGRPRLSYIPQMNAAQTIDYEQDLVNRHIIKDPLTTPYLAPRNVDQAQELMFEFQRGDISQAQRDAGLAALSKNNSYDQVQKYLLRPASSQEYNLSVSGGSTSIKYFYSASYSSEKTNQIGTDGHRLTLTANQDFKIFNIATFTSSIKASFLNSAYNGIGLNVLAPSPQQLMPYDLLVDNKGKSANYYYAYYGPILANLEKQGYLNWQYNYIDELNEANNTDKNNNYQINLGLNVPIYKGIVFNSRFAFEKNYQTTSNIYSDQTYAARNTVNDATTIGPDGTLIYGIPMGGMLQQNNGGQDNYTIRNELDYNSTFSSDHLISAIAGVELRQTTQSGSAYTYFGYNDQAQSFIPLSSLDTYNEAVTGYPLYFSNSGSILTGQSRRFLSYYANASYTYKNKYTFSASGRIDDYNNFGYDSKYRRTPLWSGGLSWNASKENFLSHVSWINNLNLRLTYGVNGNVSLTNLPFTTFSSVYNDQLTNQLSTNISSPANPSFRWERTAVINSGLDFSLFGSRLSGSVDYYLKRGTDLLYDYQIDPTYGNGNVFRNGAKLNGAGIDLGINVLAVNSHNWVYTPGFNFSYNTNKVISIPKSTPYVAAGNVGYLPGYSTDYLFVYRWAGLDKTGQSTIYDQNGNVIDSKTQLTSRDALKYIGRTSPPIIGSINQNLKYKNFGLYVQILYKLNYYFLRSSVRSYQTTSFYNYLDLSRDIANRWRNPGDEKKTNVPGLTGISYTSLDRYSNSDLLVEPGDNIRLKQVSLSYTLDENIAKKLKASNVSFTIGVRDLAILWRKNKDGIDPDFQPNLSSATTLPPSASFNFSLNANF